MNNLKDILIFSNDGINLNVISYDQLNNKEFFPTNEASKEFIKEIMDFTAIRDIKYLDNNRSVVILENGIKIIIDKVSKTLIALQDTALVEKYVEYGKNQNKQRIKEAEHVIIKKANDNKSKIIAGTLAFAIIMTGCVLAKKYKISKNEITGLNSSEKTYTTEIKTSAAEDFAKIREAELTTNSESIEDTTRTTKLETTTTKPTTTELITTKPNTLITTEKEKSQPLTTIKETTTEVTTTKEFTTDLTTVPEQESYNYIDNDIHYNRANGYLNYYDGVVANYNGHRETYYEEEILPGGGLHIPGRHVAYDGTIRDKNSYICVAADYSFLPYGTIVETTLGTAKVYDTGCSYGTIDVYVNGAQFRAYEQSIKKR